MNAAVPSNYSSPAEPDMAVRLGMVCAVVLLACTAHAARAGEPVALTVEAEPLPAKLAAIDAQWQITFKTEDQLRTVPAAALVVWGTPAEISRGPVLVLADGGLLVADVVQANRERLKADSVLFGPVSLPLELFAGVVFRPPADRHRRDLLLDRVAAGAGQSDRLLLDNGDEVTGLIESIEDDIVRLQGDVGSLAIETPRIVAILLHSPSVRRASPEGLRVWVGTGDGGRLIATRLLLEPDSARITLAGGQTWSTRVQSLVWLQPLAGRVTYLSDLVQRTTVAKTEPGASSPYPEKTSARPSSALDYRHVPFLSLSWPYRTDRNVLGGWLRCNHRLYMKGLGVHSAARLTYLLEEPYRRFEAELGIDDNTEGRGSVRFRVFVDGRQKYASGVVRGGVPPVPISLDIAGAKRLDLVVDFADRADELDHADWLNARLVR